jgi:hypothetical protein
MGLDKNAIVDFYRKNPSMSLRKMGKEFGCTYEAIRLILKQAGYVTPRSKRNIAKLN